MYLEYYVVPIVAVLKSDTSKFRFLGTGFFVGNEGHLVTCAHVVRQVTELESLQCFQIGRKKWIPLSIIRIMTDYDLALCMGIRPETKLEMPLFAEPFVQLGTDVDTYGYLHEPKGQDRLPFCRRVMRGYITSIPESLEYPNTYELSFPALFGYSGAPILSRFNIEGENQSTLGIIGCIYGSRESSIIKHIELVHEVTEENKVEREREVTARIVELGLAYNVKALFILFQESELTITIYPSSLLDELGYQKI